MSIIRNAFDLQQDISNFLFLPKSCFMEIVTDKLSVEEELRQIRHIILLIVKILVSCTVSLLLGLITGFLL